MSEQSFQQLKSLIDHLPKSKILAGDAVSDGRYKFYLSGKKTVRINEAMSNKDAIIMGDGGVANIAFAKGNYSYSSHNFGFFSKNERVVTEYIYRAIEHFLPVIDYKGFVGSGIKNIDKSFLLDLYIQILPLKEQKKIASILTSVDEVIEKIQSQINKLQDLKKGMINELLTKGIGHTKFKDSELGRIPKSWEVRRLSGLCSLHYGKSPKEIEDYDGKYPIYGTGGIVGKTNSSLHLGKSIVIGRKGSIDNVSFVDSPFWAIDTTYYIEGKNIEMKWLFYRLLYEGLKKYNEASGVPSLSRDTLYNIAIQLPPKSEQTEICVILDTVDSYISSMNNKLNQTQSLKKSLMQDLLTGKVRVQVN